MALDLPSYLLGKSKGGGGGTSNYNELSNQPSINNVTLTGDKSLDDLGIETIQYSTMPTASSSYTGKIVQYTGTSISGSYQNGYFYACVEDGGTYSWENINVQASSGGSSAVIINSSNYQSADTLTALNAEYQKYLDGETYNIYLQYTLPAWQGGGTYTLPAYIDDQGTWGSLITSEIIEYNTTQSGANSYKSLRSAYFVTNGEITSILTPELRNKELGVGTGFIAKTGNTKSYMPRQDYNISNKLYTDNINIALANGAVRYYESNTYTVGDFVYYIDNNTFEYYRCIQNAPEYTYPSDTDYWTPVTLTADQSTLVTKAYVDGLIGNINTILATLTTPSNNGGN